MFKNKKIKEKGNIVETCGKVKRHIVLLCCLHDLGNYLGTFFIEERFPDVHVVENFEESERHST